MYNKFASVYNSGTYSCSSYTNGCATVQAPNTGFFDQPPQVLYPALLGIALIVGTSSYFIARAIRKRRMQRKVSFNN